MGTTYTPETYINRKLNFLSIDVGDDVMMTHYDSIVKRILEKNGEQIPEVGSDTFAP